DGATGSAGRLILRRGILYGAATVGGANGQGTIFSLKHVPGEWQFKTLYSFKGQPDAGFPYGGLTFDQAGNIYGTTYYDGANDFGSVYQLSPQPDGSWSERVLYSFKGGKDGLGSISNLVFGKNGALYGTTSEGGAGCSCGTIFKLTSDGQGNWKETPAYRFMGAPDPAFAYNGMVADSAGNLYGATVHGGANNEGAIYKFTP
ncbi:MAG TPA: choice-of-anchor tandem repeat GloVer-containing protein, partial [Terriglobia bacterium]|nr:choice-of-anchor tandem repeat GloVer-containing protein [Terriglobia bacterium]